MKYRLSIFVIYIAFLCSTAVAGTRLEENAHRLVSQYMAALSQGDTELLLGYIGGEFLESRRTLLQNPEYSTYLTKFYADSSVSVIGARQLTDNSVAVDVVIDKTVDEHIDLVFLVEAVKGKPNNLLIVSEKEVER